MTDHLTEDEAALVAHKVVLAHLVSEAQLRLGDDAADFLDQIRRASIASIVQAQSHAADTDIDVTKQLIIDAIDGIFGVPSI